MSAPKVREMWVHPSDWSGNSATLELIRDHHGWAATPVHVRVEAIDPDEPEFAVGDQVRHKAGSQSVVAYRPILIDGVWMVPVGIGALWCCESLTKILPLVTRTIEVTGPEEAVDVAVHAAASLSGVTVRVLP